jgi:hypothetical protein
MENKYITLAGKLIESNFYMYGVGNFGINKKEVAKILEILIERGEDELYEYYKKLQLKRMG